jgi:site-specific DNA recombinase
MKVAIYARCSTDDRQDDSVAVQLTMCREWADRNGHEVVAEYIDEGLSGGLPCDKRPGAARMFIDASARLFQGIVARSNRRLGRDDVDLMVIRRVAKRQKLQLMFVTQKFSDDATGDFMWGILANVAQFERKLTGERIRAHNRHLAQIGRWPSGRPPLGYKYDPQTKTLSVDTERVNDAVSLFQTYIDNHGNRARTARILNAAGVRTREGNMWSDDTVAACIRNPLYRGLIRYQDVSTPAPVEAIIPAHLVQTVDALLENTAFKRLSGDKRTVHVLSGILTCSRCGHTFKAHQGGRESYRYLSYVCRGKKDKGVCNMPSIGSAKAERMIVVALENALKRELSRIVELENEPPGQAQEMATISRHRSLMDARSRIIDLHTAGLISKEETTRRITDIDRQLERLPLQRKVYKFTPEELEAVLDNFVANWYAWDDETRRSVLLTFCSRILVSREGGMLTLTLETCLTDLAAEISEPE